MLGKKVGSRERPPCSGLPGDHVFVDGRCVDKSDYLLVGGGLQNCLIALFLLHRLPAASLTLVEADEALGGNHTWSFHASDIPKAYREALAPAVPHYWPGYDVCFPAFTREIHCGYHAIPSPHMDRVVRGAFSEAPNGRLILGGRAQHVAADSVTLSDGRRFEARHVIDGRGLAGTGMDLACGYQKFVGLELRLRCPGPIAQPILMDARVPQLDGFRFFYVLPFSADRVLVEDTRFSTNSRLDIPAVRREIFRYAEANGLRIDEVCRVESGVLPMPYATPASWPDTMPLAAGYRGGFYHPATGYSVPVAARLAALIADCAPDSPLDQGWETFLASHQRQFRFATFLNRLLFTAYRPEDRHAIFQRFYRQDERAIERFYRLQLTTRDMANQFAGRPPRGFSLLHLLQGAPQS